ncbi:hypothetical protein BDV36DRAFT_292389 [Aspergillus pseudocaelatus]|uniref:Uncharacterized protein n=1 Tax=Aspergillus pseudocaelatus TaxID=1825620 RepID=A0ABQ6WWJ8_9EURO|nr:hypothetical protein BDV36DRAFT_292389 [Aspergillus pseudocaelatus]
MHDITNADLDANKVPYRDADLNQPFDISWMEYFYGDDTLDEEVTLRVTVEGGRLKSEASKLHPLLCEPDILKELRRDPRIGRYIVVAGSIDEGDDKTSVCSLAFRIRGAIPLDSTEA